MLITVIKQNRSPQNVRLTKEKDFELKFKFICLFHIRADFAMCFHLQYLCYDLWLTNCSSFKAVEKSHILSLQYLCYDLWLANCSSFEGQKESYLVIVMPLLRSVTGQLQPLYFKWCLVDKDWNGALVTRVSLHF